MKFRRLLLLVAAPAAAAHGLCCSQSLYAPITPPSFLVIMVVALRSQFDAPTVRYRAEIPLLFISVMSMS